MGAWDQSLGLIQRMSTLTRSSGMTLAIQGVADTCRTCSQGKQQYVRTQRHAATTFYKQAPPVSPSRVNVAAASRFLFQIRSLNDLEPGRYPIFEIFIHFTNHVDHLSVIEFYEIYVPERSVIIVQPNLVGILQHLFDTCQQRHRTFS